MTFHVKTDLNLYTLDINTSTHIAGTDQATFERVDTANDATNNAKFVQVTIGAVSSIFSLADIVKMTTLLQGQG